MSENEPLDDIPEKPLNELTPEEAWKDMASQPFGSGHPLYEESGPFRHVFNAAGMAMYGLAKVVSWRNDFVAQNKEKRKERLDALKSRNEARQMERDFDIEERRHINNLHTQAMGGATDDRRKYLEAKKRYHDGKAERVGGKIIDLGTEQPRRYKAKIRRNQEIRGKHERRAQKVARKLIELS